MSYRLRWLDEGLSIAIVARRPVARVVVGERPHTLREGAGGVAAFDLEIDGQRYAGWRCLVGDEVHVHLNGRRYRFGLPQTLWKVDASDRHGHEVHADMPGVVIAVHCAAGQTVQAGDKLVTIESMKLQVSLVASRDGVVAAVHVAPETSFERGALLVSFLHPAAEAT